MNAFDSDSRNCPTLPFSFARSHVDFRPGFEHRRLLVDLRRGRLAGHDARVEQAIRDRRQAGADRDAMPDRQVAFHERHVFEDFVPLRQQFDDHRHLALRVDAFRPVREGEIASREDRAEHDRSARAVEDDERVPVVVREVDDAGLRDVLRRVRDRRVARDDRQHEAEKSREESHADLLLIPGQSTGYVLGVLS
jgi:hypothetical protein